MRHIICENLVEQQLANAKKKKPSFLVLLVVLGQLLSVVGFVGFAATILAAMFSFGLLDISIGIPPKLAFFGALLLFGFLLSAICASLAGLSPHQMDFRNLLLELRGGEEVGRLEAGVKGEEAVVKELQGLDDRWVLSSGVVLVGTMGDIDHVLIGPSGVYAIEVKNWSGKIEYSDDTSTWTRYKTRLPQGEVLKDPAEQVVQLSGVLGNTLKEKSVPVVVFVNPNSTVSGSDHPRATILTLSQLKKWVTSQPARLSPEKVDALSSKLTGAFKKVPYRPAGGAKTKVSTPATPSKATAPDPASAAARPGRSCRTPLAILIILGLAASGVIVLGVQFIGITKPSGCTKVVTTYIRSGPSLNDELLDTTSKGTCFNYDGRTKDGYWVRITGINGFRGGWTTVNYIDLTQEEITNLPVVK